MDDALRLTRKCAKMVNECLAHLGVGNQAEYFDGEDPDQWQILDPSEIYNTKGDIMRLTVMINNDTAQIVIPRLVDCIRREHRSKFDHRQYLIQDVPPIDFKGDHEPQLVITCAVPEDNEILQGPRQYIPRRRNVRHYKVHRQYQ